MATDLPGTVHRYHLILAQLVERLPPVDRDARLARQAADLQIAIDEVLVAIGVDVSTGLETDPAPRLARPESARARKKRLAKWRADTDALIAAQDAAEEAAEAALSASTASTGGPIAANPIAPIDTATVPGVIRAVLANDTAGLLPRQIIEAVRRLRPETDEAGVHGALHQMRKRGELARIGFHKNYRYRLIPHAQVELTRMSGMNDLSPGGATH